MLESTIDKIKRKGEDIMGDFESNRISNKDYIPLKNNKGETKNINISRLPRELKEFLQSTLLQLYDRDGREGLSDTEKQEFYNNFESYLKDGEITKEEIPKMKIEEGLRLFLNEYREIEGKEDIAILKKVRPFIENNALKKMLIGKMVNAAIKRGDLFNEIAPFLVEIVINPRGELDDSFEALIKLGPDTIPFIEEEIKSGSSRRVQKLILIKVLEEMASRNKEIVPRVKSVLENLQNDLEIREEAGKLLKNMQ
ncbi:MAG: hypothetical protein ABIH00_08180 [Armatimonadota bacterium]